MTDSDEKRKVVDVGQKSADRRDAVETAIDRTKSSLPYTWEGLRSRAKRERGRGDAAAYAE